MVQNQPSRIGRVALRGAVVFVTGLIAAGCAERNFWPSGQPSERTLSGTSLSSDSAHRPKMSSTFSLGSKQKSVEEFLTLARLSERRNQRQQAERLYSAVIEKDPGNPVPYHRLGVMWARKGRFREAEQYFSKALELAPSDAKLLSDVGYCYYLQNRLSEAEQFLRRAYESEPGDPAINNNLAIVLGEQGRDQECLATFRRTGSEAEAYANLAFVYAQRGDLEKAKAAYSQALTLDRNLRPAAEAMVQIAQHEQQYQWLAAAAQGSPPGSRRTDQTPGWPQVESRHGSPAQESYAQPATFLLDASPTSMVEVTDMGPLAEVGQTGSVPDSWSTSYVAQPATRPAGTDIGQGLSELIVQPGYAGN